MIEPERRRALVIGSGRRIRNNFLPALHQLDDRIDVVGLWSRTTEHAHEAAGPWGVPVVDRIADVLGDVDTVIVSVSTSAVPSVLACLTAAAPRLALVVDTPVVGSARDLRELATLARFGRVLVAEDYMAYPQWDVMRACVSAGGIGPVTSVELRHSGYRYHGLALIRSLLGFPLARSVRRRDTPDGPAWTYRFGRGRWGRIVEPYDQSRGTTTVVGRRGIITDDARLVAGQLPVMRLQLDDGIDGASPGFTLGALRHELPHLRALLAADVADTSVFNALKTCGLMTVLSSLAQPEGPYDHRQALYDHLTTAASRHAPLLVDPLAVLGANYVGVLDRLVRRRAAAAA